MNLIDFLNEGDYMDMKEVTAFATIIKEGTFTKAANKLNYAQSTITNQIQRLETELGVKLFERDWGAKLTPQGETFAEHVDNLLQHWDYVIDEMALLGSEEKGIINIGIHENFANIIPVIFKRFKLVRPHFKCNFVVATTELFSNMLLENKIDFALCGKLMLKETFTFEKIYNEEICFITSKKHPLVGKERQIDELYDFPIVTGGRNCITSHRLKEEFDDFYSEAIIHSTTMVSLIPIMVEETDAIGVVTKSIQIDNSVCYLDVEMKNPVIEIGVLSNQEFVYLTATKKILIDLIKTCLPVTVS